MQAVGRFIVDVIIETLDPAVPEMYKLVSCLEWSIVYVCNLSTLVDDSCRVPKSPLCPVSLSASSQCGQPVFCIDTGFQYMSAVDMMLRCFSFV